MRNISFFKLLLFGGFLFISIEAEREIVIPPQIYSFIAPEEKIFLKGETIELNCGSDGIPLPKNSWKKNQKAIVENERIEIKNGKIIIKNARKSDEGYYQCYATNLGGTSVTDKITLRMAFLESFRNAKTRNYRVKTGEILKLSCNAPRSYPAPEIFWVHKCHKNNSITPVILNRRIAMDPEGNLYILAVAVDSIDGKEWACAVRNKFSRQTRIGAYNVIQPQPNLAQSQPHKLLYASPTQQVALHGETIQFVCIFGGESTLNIQWGRTDGQGLKNSHEIEKFGRQLTLRQVDSTDSGTYFCFCRGTEHHINLRVESERLRPEWDKMPQSVDANEYDTVEFRCSSKDKKNTLTSWYINSESIHKINPDPRRIVTKNSLTITNVTVQDIQVIQCNISSNYGYVFASAYLNINLRPNVKAKPLQDAVEGTIVLLDWEIIGHPKPSVQWTKGNVIISENGRFRITSDGSLRIYNVSVEDAGLYTCTAINTAGNMSASGSLLVISPAVAVNKQDRVYNKRDSTTKGSDNFETAAEDLSKDNLKSKEIFDKNNNSRKLEVEVMNILSMLILAFFSRFLY